MAKLNFSVIKKRPVLTGSIIVIGGLVLYFLFMRPSASEESQSRGGYTDEMVLAGGAINAANQAAAARAQEIQAQLAGMQIQASNALAMKNSDNETAKALAALSLQAAREQNAVEMFGIQVQGDIEKLGLEKSAEINKLQISSQLAALQSNNETQAYIQKLMIEGQLNLSAMATEVSLANIQSQENISRHSMDVTQNLAAIAANTQIALGQFDVDKTRIQASAATKQNKSSNMWGAIGSIAAGAFALFSDINIKSVEGCVSVDACLRAINAMPVDFWRYMEGTEPANDGDTRLHAGTYAQSFYKEIGASDWESRVKIDIVDYFGATTGAIQALSKLMSIKAAA